MRILVTGAREWADYDAIEKALLHAAWGVHADPIAVVHGGALGADQMAEQVAREWGWDYTAYSLYRFASARERNQYMVNLGADVCLAFALKWASGTGMCARMARKAGIPVIDYGVSTDWSDRPSGS